jgi:hypothetical protein
MRKCGKPRRVDSQEAATARPRDGACSGHHRASTRDKRRPSHIRLGYSHRASGRVVVVVECRSFATPRLTQLGWQRFARGGATWLTAACRLTSGFGVVVSVFDDRFQLQKPIDGMWPAKSR